jgi:tRNA threonylcarbamoyladenosine biosynthesis protein TsaB
MLDERGLTLADCDAICVSKGPGSYTGLRVGVSTAKGLCFGSGKPLIAVGTLDTLVFQALSDNTPINEDGTPHVISDVPHTNACDTPHVIADVPHTNACGTPHVIARSEATWQSVPFKYIIPMIDARRMEVYTAVFEKGVQITETAPMIIDETSFGEYLEQGPCLFIGDGAGKCADVIRHPNAQFCQCWPKASSMLEPAMKAYKEKRFEDVAYFEPFYLKEFVATVSKKKLF